MPCFLKLKRKKVNKQNMLLLQSAKQAMNWKVMLGLKKIEWLPTCDGCGKEGKENFCCPKCASKEIWSEDILKGGKLIHKC